MAETASHPLQESCGHPNDHGLCDRGVYTVRGPIAGQTASEVVAQVRHELQRGPSPFRLPCEPPWVRLVFCAALAALLVISALL